MEKTAFDGKALEKFIDRLPDGRAKLLALQDAVTQADAAEEPYWRLTFRWNCACEAYFHDDAAKCIPAAAEFAALYEQYPDALPKGTGAEAYVMITQLAVDIMQHLPQISLQQYDQTLASYRDLTVRFHMGERTYWWQMHNRWEYVDAAQALEYLQRAWKTQRDDLSDCEACEHTRAVKLYLRLGEREIADRYARRLQSHSVFPCEDSFQLLYLAYLEDALDRGDLEQAVPLAEKLYRKGNRTRADLCYLGAVLRCWSFLNTDKALSLFTRRLEWTFGVWDQKLVYDFYKGAWVCFREIARKRDQVKMKLPQAFPLWREDGVYSAAALRDWFYTQAAAIAEKFDWRNGARFFETDLSLAGKRLS